MLEDNRLGGCRPLSPAVRPADATSLGPGREALAQSPPSLQHIVDEALADRHTLRLLGRGLRFLPLLPGLLARELVQLALDPRLGRARRLLPRPADVRARHAPIALLEEPA